MIWIFVFAIIAVLLISIGLQSEKSQKSPNDPLQAFHIADKLKGVEPCKKKKKTSRQDHRTKFIEKNLEKMKQRNVEKTQKRQALPEILPHNQVHVEIPLVCDEKKVSEVKTSRFNNPGASPKDTDRIGLGIFEQNVEELKKNHEPPADVPVKDYLYYNTQGLELPSYLYSEEQSTQKDQLNTATREIEDLVQDYQSFLDSSKSTPTKELLTESSQTIITCEPQDVTMSDSCKNFDVILDELKQTSIIEESKNQSSDNYTKRQSSQAFELWKKQLLD